MTPRLFALLSSGWHPRNMFRGGELGAVLAPSNLSSVYQDSIGTTAGAVGSPVGRILDEQFSLARNGELAPALEAANWTVVGADATHVVTFSGGTMRYQSDTTSPTLTVQKASMLVVGKTYEITGFVSSFTGGNLKADGLTYTSAFITQAGAFRLVSTATATTFGLLRNSANTDLTLSSLSVREIPGNHAVQATAGSRPNLATGGKIDYDGVDDSLVITFPSDMGTACTVGRSVPQGEATILTGQTITTTYTDSTDHCGLVIINRALTATETNQLRRWLNRRAG